MTGEEDGARLDGEWRGRGIEQITLLNTKAVISIARTAHINNLPRTYIRTRL